LTYKFVRPQHCLPFVVGLAAIVLLTACSSSSSSTSKATSTSTTPSAADLSAEVASYDLAVGPPARFLVGVLTNDKQGVSYGTIQVRFCFRGVTQPDVNCRYGKTQTAAFLTIPGSPPPPAGATAPQAISSAQSKGVYATEASFDRAGVWQAEVEADVGGARRRGAGEFQVLEHHAIPAPGDAALATPNLTSSTPDTPPAAVDSRASAGGLIPDPDLHRSTIAAALAAHRPILAVFSTPVYCISRFCGPITDMVDDLAKTYGDRATFIHVEVWRDYQRQQVNKGAADWLYRNNDLTEPWVFLIGADGKIVDRWDNVATRAEIEPLLSRLPVIGP
jgi:hypothetical protein